MFELILKVKVGDLLWLNLRFWRKLYPFRINSNQILPFILFILSKENLLIPFKKAKEIFKEENLKYVVFRKKGTFDPLKNSPIKTHEKNGTLFMVRSWHNHELTSSYFPYFKLWTWLPFKEREFNCSLNWLVILFPVNFKGMKHNLSIFLLPISPEIYQRVIVALILTKLVHTL